MDLHKHNREKATDHIGKLKDADVDEQMGGRFGDRFRSLMQQLMEIRRWVTQRCNVFRVETPHWSSVAVAGSYKPMTWQKTIIGGNRLDGTTRAFYCNRAGVYHASGLFAADVTAGTVYHPRLALLVNGELYSWLDIETGTVTKWVLQGSDLVTLQCGDKLELAFWFGTKAGSLTTINFGSGIYESYGYFGAHWECECTHCPEVTLDDVDPGILPPTFGDGAPG